MQRFVSDDIWDEAQMRHIYHQLVYEDMGAPDGIVIVDESGFPKKGKDSVGVARQYCGTLGKVENCQVGVFAAYASPHGYALVAQFIGGCSRLKWSKPVTNSPLLALLAMAGSKAACKISSACLNAF